MRFVREKRWQIEGQSAASREMLVKSVESIRFYVRSALFLMTPKSVTATFEISTQFTDHSRLSTLSGKPRIGRAEYFVLLQNTAFDVGCGPTFFVEIYSTILYDYSANCLLAFFVASWNHGKLAFTSVRHGATCRRHSTKGGNSME